MIQKIKLTGLEVFANHGVYEFEREHGQRFVIDVSLTIDATAAATQDDIQKTIHYAELADAIVADVASDPVDLIETVAQRLLRLVLEFGGEDSPIKKAKITVHKPDAPINHPFEDVSVTVTGKR